MDPVILACGMVMQHENFLALPYYDSEGILSIGYGTNLEQGISRAAGAYLLLEKLQSGIIELRASNIYRELDPVRQAVLIDMCYNLGYPKLAKFQKMWAALSKSDFETAANEMVNSKWYSQVKSRAVRLVAMMRTGEIHG